MTLDQWYETLLSYSENYSREDMLVFADWLEQTDRDVMAQVFRNAYRHGWVLVNVLPTGSLVFADDDWTEEYHEFFYYEGGGPDEFRSVVHEDPDYDKCDHCGCTGGCDCDGSRYEEFDFDDDWVEQEFPALRPEITAETSNDDGDDDIPF